MIGEINYVLSFEDPEYNKDQTEDAKKAKMESLRRRFIVGMRKETLVVQEERVGKYIFVKISCPQERMYKEAETMRTELPLLGLVLDHPEQKERMIEKKMKKLFTSQERETKVSAPFQRNCIELFKDSENESIPILWSSIRCLLAHNILININISRYSENGELPEKIGLPYLLMVGAFSDGFPLHDPSVKEPVSMTEVRRRVQDLTEVSPEVDLRLYLSKTWGSVFRKQPIHEIRDYFGEKIAFYFGWVSTLMMSLWIPTALGLAVFIYGITRRLEHLKEKGAMYIIGVIKSSSDNDLTPAFAAIICLWGTIFMEVWKRKQISLARQWYVDNFDNVELDRPQFYGTNSQLNPFTNQLIMYYPAHKRIIKYLFSLSILVIMVMLVFISVTAVILYRVYMTVSFCNKGDSVCDMLHGTVIATLLNTFSIMILGRVYENIAVKLTEWENHRTLSEYNDALIIKLFAFQFANTYASLFYTAFFRRNFGTGILGLSDKYTDNCGHAESSNCMSLLSFQLLTLMVIKPLPKFAKDVIWPWLKKVLRQCKFNEIDDITTDEGSTKQHHLLREMLKPAAEDFRLGEFTEKIIQYGYLMLFAASFPLAPALALIFNMIDFKVDSRRLLWWNKRPTPYRDNDIGIWFQILDFINVCGVISNAFLIAFTSELGREQPLYIKFAIVIGFEHLIFMIKFGIDLLIPDVPTWVKNSQRKERFLLSYLMTKMNCYPTPGTSRQFQDSVEVDDEKNGIDIRLNLTEETREDSLPKYRWSYG